MEVDVAVPAAFVTVIGPAVTPDGTVAVIDVADVTVNDAAAAPLNLTAVIPAKFVPVITVVSPAIWFDGVNDMIVGA